MHNTFLIRTTVGSNSKRRQVGVNLPLVFEHLYFLRIPMDNFPIVIPAFPAAPIVQNPFGKRKIELLLTPRRHTVTHPPFVDPEPAVSTPETGKAVQCKIKNLVSLFQPLLLAKRRIISINDPALVLIQKLPGKLPCFGFIRSFQPGSNWI